MAKKQTFADKVSKKSDTSTCPICERELQFVKHVKAVRTDSGSWKYRTVNTALCACNEKEIYA